MFHYDRELEDIFEVQDEVVQAYPLNLPKRHFIYDHCIIRRFLSLLIAPGGVGKTALIIVEALSLTTGRGLLGHPVYGGPYRVSIWNLEDPIDELNRRIAAACLHYEISSEDLGIVASSTLVNVLGAVIYDSGSF